MSITETQSAYSATALYQQTSRKAEMSGDGGRVEKVSSASDAGAAKTIPQVTGVTPDMLSSEAAATLLTLQSSEDGADAGRGVPMDTGEGNTRLDLDAYFSDEPSAPVDLADAKLLLPSPANIAALQEHAGSRFRQMLAEYGIPEAPDRITYSSDGKMQLPADYPHATELKQSLEENPGLDRELRTLNVLTSHFAATQEALPFHEEYSAASSQAGIEAILAKYSHLFRDDRPMPEVALTVSSDGALGVTADGKPIRFA